MTEPSLALQKAIRAQLVASPSLTALVPAANVFDRSTRPEKFPCIIVGDGQTVLAGDDYGRRRVRIYADLHVWTKEDGLAQAKTIAGAISDAIRGASAWAVEDHHCADFYASGSRFLRDPAGQNGHAIVTVESLLERSL